MHTAQPFCEDIFFLEPSHSVGFSRGPTFYSYKMVALTPWGEFHGVPCCVFSQCVILNWTNSVSFQKTMYPFKTFLKKTQNRSRRFRQMFFFIVDTASKRRSVYNTVAQHLGTRGWWGSSARWSQSSRRSRRKRSCWNLQHGGMRFRQRNDWNILKMGGTSKWVVYNGQSHSNGDFKHESVHIIGQSD